MSTRMKTLLRGPREGWISPILVALLVLPIAWSMDDARWVLGSERYLDFLVPATVWGVVIGFAGAKLGWGRWLTYLTGAVLAALVVPLYVGNILLPEGSWIDQYRATAASMANAWTDLAIENQTVTREYGHFLVVLGSFIWATALYAAYTTFGHRRPLNAIVLVGLLLVGNMGFTFNQQLTFLVIFTLAALFLLIRFHAFDEEAEWVRRRIGDPGTVSAIYLRGGTAFIAVAIAGSLVLTETASSAPLAGALRGVGDNVVEWGRGFERLLPQGGANRPFGVDFGDTARLGNNWNFAPGRAMVIEVPPDAPRDMYWRAATYDKVEPGAWRQEERKGVTVDTGVPLLPEGAADYVAPEGRQEVTFRVIPEGYQRSVLFSPATPTTVDHPVLLSVIGGEGFFAGIEGNGNAPYTITALVPIVGDEEDPEGLTANRLRVAGTDYPDDVEARYLEVPADVAAPGGPTANLLEEVREAANDPDNPYDLAFLMERYLKSSAIFDYRTDLSGIPCDGLSVADCFARERIGFCQQYATTMAVMLRMAGIPSRYVSGFLPGPRVNGVERISFSSAHAWVEAYFPGHGWVRFDPTGGSLDGQADPLPPGEEVAAPSPSPSARPGASGPAPTRRPFDEPPGGPAVQGGATPPGGADSAGILIAVTLLLLLTVGGLAYVAWQRGPRGDLTPDGAYSTLTRMAGRLGFGPRPTQTVYEFAGALGDVLPQSRPEIQTVAQAKVEVAYGGRALGADRMAALSEAQRRLRVGLLRLLLRRGSRPRRRR